jgi:parallel beta-helix repeat protein
MKNVIRNKAGSLLWGVLLMLGINVPVLAATYNVGPGQQYTNLSSVRWSSLAAGDTVYIHYGVYREKFNLTTQGTAENPIRIIGVPDANGNRPVIDGQNAVTAPHSDFRWAGSQVIQWLGVVFITPGIGENAPLPKHIEIKNLEIRNGYVNSTFTGEDGSTSAYNGFAAGIYIRSAQNILIENCVIHSNGQGIYGWTGSGDSWWDGTLKNVTLRKNHFYNNGHTNSYTEHQTYLEGENTIYEFNRYGAQRSGALGSSLKDRGAGTVIRYNYFETTTNGWWIDLVEPENGWMALGFSNPKYSQAFIYGNLFVNNGTGRFNYFHWNEDHQAQGNNGTAGQNGRAAMAGGRLFFYHNTVLTVANRHDISYWNSFTYFNTTWGGYECANQGTRPGAIDIRNNIFAVIPRTAGSAIPTQQLAYCSDQNFNLGKNLISDGWIANTSGTVTGASNMVAVSDYTDFAFANASTGDLRLLEGSIAAGAGAALAPEVTNNTLGMDLTPNAQYVVHLNSQQRTSAGAGSTMGAVALGNETPVAPPQPPNSININVQ